MRSSLRRLWQYLGLALSLLLTHPARWQGTVERWRRDNDPHY
jgi:hypothetical protein